jgi:hypothetical protein
MYRKYGMTREANDGRSSDAGGSADRPDKRSLTIWNAYMPPSGGWMMAAGAARNRLFTGKVRLRVSPLSSGPGLSRGIHIIH